MVVSKVARSKVEEAFLEEVKEACSDLEEEVKEEACLDLAEVVASKAGANCWAFSKSDVLNVVIGFAR